MTEKPSNSKVILTGGRLLARNVLWNVVGTGAPLLVAFVCLPILIGKLGKDRFGVLALAWALIGYAGLFDLGLGRALTKLVSEKLGKGLETEIPELFWTSQAVMILLSLGGMFLLAVIAPSLVYRILKIPKTLQVETLHSFYALAFSMPIVISTAGLRGFLEAHQRFGLTNMLRVPMGLFTFVGPLLVLPFSDSIFPVVIILIAGRVVAWAAHLVICFHVVPALPAEMAIQPERIGPLFRLGGWMTVGNIIGPLMLYMDRFVIGALISATAVAYYITPYEVVTKLLIISTAISGVMFPAFSSSSAQDLGRSSTLFRRTTRYTLAILLPLTVLLFLGAKAGLSLWLGPNFASNSYRVAQFLLIGTFALGMGALPFALTQGIGRPDIAAKLNLAEIPFYAFGLYWSIQHYGVSGAAAIWTLRAVADSVLLFFFAYRFLRKPHGSVREGSGSVYSPAALVEDIGTNGDTERSPGAAVLHNVEQT